MVNLTQSKILLVPYHKKLAVITIPREHGCGSTELIVIAMFPPHFVDKGQTVDEHQRLKVLERENRELRRSNDILRQASAYLAQAELDRHWKNVMNASHSLNTGQNDG